MHAAVDSEHPAPALGRDNWSLTFKARIPMGTAPRDPRSPKYSHRATFADSHRSNAGHAQPILIWIEFERAAAVRKLDLVPPFASFEPRISSLFAPPDSPKERLHRKIEPVQNCVLALAINRRNPRVVFAQCGELGVLHLCTYRNPARFVSAAALLQERIEELPRHVQSKIKPFSLTPGWIKPDSLDALHRVKSWQVSVPTGMHCAAFSFYNRFMYPHFAEKFRKDEAGTK